MSTLNVVISLRNDDQDWWEFLLSDGKHEETIWMASARSKSLLDLFRAVQLLLQGASKAKCTWDAAFGEYHWHFSRQEKQIQIHIIWFDEMTIKRKTILRTKCDLLTFARELLHQVSQFPDPENKGKPAILPKDSQNFQEAIKAFE